MRLTDSKIKRLSYEHFNVKLDEVKIAFILSFLKDNQLSYIKEGIDYGQATKWKRLNELPKETV